LATIAEDLLALCDLKADYAEATARSQHLVAAARDNTKALQVQIATARRSLAVSADLLKRATEMASLSYCTAIAMTPKDRTPAGSATESAPRTFAAVTELIDQVERAVLKDVDLAATLTANIKNALRGETDAALLIAVLLEGISQTVIQRVPAEEWREMLVALCGVLCNRINEHGNRPD
jgi:hypothetical protein